MRYYLDTEFDGFGGALLSLALVREDGNSLYLVYSEFPKDKWVRANVLPIIWSIPSAQSAIAYRVDRITGARNLQTFFHGDSDPVVITDWPDDIRYLCEAVIVGPGKMIDIPSLKFEMHRVDAYPTALADAIQHNAWWDAQALRHKLAPESFR